MVVSGRLKRVRVEGRSGVVNVAGMPLRRPLCGTTLTLGLFISIDTCTTASKSLHHHCLNNPAYHWTRCIAARDSSKILRPPPYGPTGRANHGLALCQHIRVLVMSVKSTTILCEVSWRRGILERESGGHGYGQYEGIEHICHVSEWLHSQEWRPMST